MVSVHIIRLCHVLALSRLPETVCCHPSRCLCPLVLWPEHDTSGCFPHSANFTCWVYFYQSSSCLWSMRITCKCIYLFVHCLLFDHLFLTLCLHIHSKTSFSCFVSKKVKKIRGIVKEALSPLTSIPDVWREGSHLITAHKHYVDQHLLPEGCTLYTFIISNSFSSHDIVRQNKNKS